MAIPFPLVIAIAIATGTTASVIPADVLIAVGLVVLP